MDDKRAVTTRAWRVRRAVLGEAHVERALRARTPFNREFQDLLTRYAWGEIWTRPGLPRRTRSLITLAAMVALDRSEELRLHLRAALRNGVTPRRDQGSPAADGGLLRAARRERRLPSRGRGLRGGGRRQAAQGSHTSRGRRAR